MQLKCLSIQQPWADLILNGEKFVENRTWIWMQNRNWKLTGSVPLGIHVSSGVTTWRKLDNDEREHYAPGWTKGDSEVGGVQGVVDLVQICRPKDLPPRLRRHKFVINEPDNWC